LLHAYYFSALCVSVLFALLIRQFVNLNAAFFYQICIAARLTSKDCCLTCLTNRVAKQSQSLRE
jgi:hypothetical protein